MPPLIKAKDIDAEITDLDCKIKTMQPELIKVIDSFVNVNRNTRNKVSALFTELWPIVERLKSLRKLYRNNQTSPNYERIISVEKIVLSTYSILSCEKKRERKDQTPLEFDNCNTNNIFIFLLYNEGWCNSYNLPPSSKLAIIKRFLVKDGEIFLNSLDDASKSDYGILKSKLIERFGKLPSILHINFKAHKQIGHSLVGDRKEKIGKLLGHLMILRRLKISLAYIKLQKDDYTCVKYYISDVYTFLYSDHIEVSKRLSLHGLFTDFTNKLKEVIRVT